MKKFFAAFLAAALMLTGVSAMAAGKLSVTNEVFHVFEHSSWADVYIYAKIENVGDKPISVHSGIVEIYDENGDVITSADYLNAYAKYLQPGEYTYAKMSVNVEEGNPVPADYMLTISGKSEKDYSNLRLPVETSLDMNAKDRWDNDVSYMYATVTNNTEEPLYSINCVMALLDAEGNIIALYDDGLYSDKALMPGSSVIFRRELYSDIKDYMENNSITPTAVDAIAYVEQRAD